jgi:piezo-type mechanosensitive ion channel component 1/2
MAVQFATIIADRLLYLRRAMKVKIVFHFFNVIYIHVWLFLLLPIYYGRSVKTSPAIIVYYIIKGVYFLVSGYQIRYGK